MDSVIQLSDYWDLARDSGKWALGEDGKKIGEQSELMSAKVKNLGSEVIRATLAGSLFAGWVFDNIYETQQTHETFRNSRE